MTSFSRSFSSLISLSSPDSIELTIFSMSSFLTISSFRLFTLCFWIREYIVSSLSLIILSRCGSASIEEESFSISAARSSSSMRADSIRSISVSPSGRNDLILAIFIFASLSIESIDWPSCENKADEPVNASFISSAWPRSSCSASSCSCSPCISFASSSWLIWYW